MILRVDEVDDPHDGSGTPWPLRPRDLAVGPVEAAMVTAFLRTLAAGGELEVKRQAGELARALRHDYAELERWRETPAANRRPSWRPRR